MNAGPLDERIWLHTGGRLLKHVPELARTAGGVMLSGLLTGPLANEICNNSVPVAIEHRPDTSDVPANPELLSRTDQDIDQAWLLTQLRRDVSVVASRGNYLARPSAPEPARRQIRAAVNRIRAFVGQVDARVPTQPRIGLLAVDRRWLSQIPLQKILIEGMSNINAPVGLMIAHKADPLADVRVIDGLIKVVTSRSDVFLLRSDHAALGAFAFGAAGGSIGIGTGSRHYVPPGQRGWKDDDRTPRLLIPSLWEFWRGSRFDAVPDDPLYRCVCFVCRNRSLARFQNELLKEEADRHTVAVWSTTATNLSKVTGGDREHYWLQMCREAAHNLRELEDRHGILQMPQAQLEAWCEFAGIPV